MGASSAVDQFFLFKKKTLMDGIDYLGHGF
jgi:hypothetical protein